MYASAKALELEGRLEEAAAHAEPVEAAMSLTGSAASQWRTYEEEPLCSDCQPFHPQEGEEWGPCDIVGGSLLNALGWCSSWVERQA